MTFPAKDEFKSSYKFIGDIFLSAIVSKTSGNQTLLIEKVDPITGRVKFSEKIECIHTAVVDISPDHFFNPSDDRTITEKSINIRSSENLTEIYLEPEEKYKAFKSWVAGIAESGFDALRIQSQIEDEAKLVFPITHLLMKFFSRMDIELMITYIKYLKEVCIYEGIQHKSSLISNLSPIFSLLRTEEFSDENKILILSSIFEINPPFEIFTEEIENMIFLEIPDAISMRNFTELFTQNREIRFHLIKNPMITKLDEFAQFLSFKTEPDSDIRKIAASLDEAVKFKEYKNFLNYKTEPDHRVRRKAAMNPLAVEIDEYKNFLNYKTEPNDNVRKMAARNLNSVKLAEFKNLLSINKEPSVEVRRIADKSQKSIQLNVNNESIHIDGIEMQKTDKTISGSDFKKFFKLKNRLDALRLEFAQDYQEIMDEIKDMEKFLLPPDIKLEEEMIRELQRLKDISLKKKY